MNVQLGTIWVGRSWKGTLSEVLSQKEFLDAKPGELPPNTTWKQMTVEKAIEDDEIRPHLLEYKLKELILEVV